MRTTGLVALTEGEPMTGLPASLSIGLWLVGSTWLIAIIARVFDASPEIVHAALAIGLIVGTVEWLASKGRKR